MGFLQWLSGSQDVANVTVSFQPPGQGSVSVQPFPACTRWFLDVPSLNAAMFFFYAAKALHALGSATEATELRSRLAADAASMVARDRLDVFSPDAELSAQCSGRLQGNKNTLFISTRFPTPSTRTNRYVAGSVLLLRDFAYFAQDTPEQRRAIGGAIINVERHYNMVAVSNKFEAIRSAPIVALSYYLDSGGTTGKPPS